MTKTCERPGCDTELKTGRHYCSTSCSAQDRKRKREANVTALATHPSVPASVQSFFEERFDSDESALMLREMESVLAEVGDVPLPPLTAVTERDYDVAGVNLGFGDRRPGDKLDYTTIEQMQKSGPVTFVIEMKKASLLSVFRNDRSIKVVCPDAELQRIAQANIQQIIPLMAADFLDSALYYGASFQEVVWKYSTAYELGLSTSRGAVKLYVVADMPHSIKPTTVDRINRVKETGDFDGFVQKSKTRAEDIIVSRDRALVVTHSKRWGNLWGESALKPMYPAWFWYQVTLRAMVRFLERMGTPVTVCYAPSKGSITQPGTTTKVSTMKWGLMIAGTVAKSNAIVLPSDQHPETGEPLWRLEYLTSPDRTDMFVKALEFMTQEVVRAGLTADRTLTQSSGGVGSYNIGEIHNAATMLHNELLLTSILAQINRYFMPRYSLYNRGVSGPPIWLETEGLDPAEKERLFKLISLIGNKQDSDVLTMIDWRTLLGIENIPLLTEEEVEELKKQQLKEAKAKQKAFIKEEKPAPFGKKDDDDDEDSKGKEDESDKDEDKKDADSDLNTVTLFNPFHDPGSGRFASKRGGAGGGGASGGSSGGGGGGGGGAEAVGSAKGGSILKTAGAVLGIAGIGVVVLAVMGAGGGGGAEGVVEEAEEETEDWPKDFESEEAVFEYLQEEMKDMGVTGLPSDLKMKVVPMSEFEVAGALAYYEAGINTLVMPEHLAQQAMDGNPMAIMVLTHEILHSNQETEDPLRDSEWGFRLDVEQTEENMKRFGEYFEGQNDLLTMLGMAQMYERPVTHGDAQMMDLTLQMSRGNLAASTMGVGFGYPEEAAQWATIAKAAEKKIGMPAEDYLMYMHNDGFNQPQQRDGLYQLFPEIIASYQAKGEWPPLWVLADAAVEEYGVDPDQSINEMLEEAAGPGADLDLPPEKKEKNKGYTSKTTVTHAPEYEIGLK